MSSETETWRPASLLPAADGRSPALIFVVAVLAFLACLAAIGALASERAAEGWRDQLVGQATVIVRAAGLESADAAAARAAETLAGVPGVAEARAMEKARSEALVARFIGPEPLPADLPIPRLVAVEFKAVHPASVADLRRALEAEGLDATVEDHSLWTAQIMRTGSVARWAALGLFLLIAAAAGAVVAYGVRAGLEARSDLVEILHVAGASDAFIARLFQARFGRTAALAGAAGAVAAAAAAAALHLFATGQSVAAIMPVTWSDLAAVLPCPFLAALIAAITARLTAEAALKKAS